MNLTFSKVFSSVNIDDSKRMQKMTEAAVRDSAGTSLNSYTLPTLILVKPYVDSGPNLITPLTVFFR